MNLEWTSTSGEKDKCIFLLAISTLINIMKPFFGAGTPSRMAKLQEVKKHTSAIHTSGSLGLLERKISNVLLYNAYDELLVEQRHTISTSVLAEISGYRSNDYEGLKNAVRKLASTLVEWDILESDGVSAEWGVSTLLSSVRFLKGGVCQYEYTTAIAEKLKEPDVYAKINLQIQKQFSSGHALTIYEMCVQTKGFLKKRSAAYTKWLSLDQFKLILGVTENKSYEQFKELNRTIIKPAVAEINGTGRKHIGTDLFITPEFKHLGRSVSDIRFKVTLNPQAVLELETDEKNEIRKSKMYARLLEHGVNDSGAIHICQAYDEQYIEEKLLLVEEDEAKGKIKSSVAGYLRRAIDDDYKPARTKSDARAKLELEAQEAENLRERQARLAEDQLRKEIDAAIDVRTEYLALLPEDEKSALLKELKQELPQIMRSMVKDLTHPSLCHEIDKRIPNFQGLLEAKLAE